MTESGQTTSGSWWRTPLLHRVAKLHQGEDQVFLVLALVIGALTGLAVVAFILLTERVGLRLYPADGVPWRRLLLPVVGSLGIGYLLFSYFPDARGSGGTRRRGTARAVRPLQDRRQERGHASQGDLHRARRHNRA